MVAYVHIICLIFSVFGSLTAARRSARISEKVEIPIADSSLVGEYRAVDAVLERARRDAAFELRKADREFQAYEGRVNRRQGRLERRRQERLRQEAEERAALELKKHEQAKKVKQEAEAQVKKILEDAEKRAIDLRNRLHEQDALDRLGNRPRITREWRQSTESEFASDSGFIKDVVMSGEVSSVERESYKALFDEQQKWFKKTLGQVEFFFDDQYQRLMKKKNEIAVVADAQKQADEILFDIANQYHLSPQARDQLRLQALYEINAQAQEPQKEQVFLSAESIRALVDRVTHAVAPGQKEITVISEKEHISALEQRIAELEGQLLDADDDKLPLLSIQKKKGEKPFVTKELFHDASLSKELLEAEVKKQTESAIAVIDKKIEEQYKLKEAIQYRSLHRKSRRAAELDREIQQLIAEKRALVDNARTSLQQKYAQLQSADNEEEMSAVEEEAEQQKKAAIELEILKQQRDEAQEMLMVYEKSLQTERDRASLLTQQLGKTKTQVKVLAEKVESLDSKQKKIYEKYRADHDQLLASIEERQQEKIALEVALAQVKEQLETLTHTSGKRLLELASYVEEKEAKEDDLERLLDQKTRERTELEMAITRSETQLKDLAQASQEMSFSLMEQLRAYDVKCQQLEQRLTEKQEAAASLGVLVEQMRSSTKQALTHADKLSLQAQYNEQARTALKERIVHLQYALSNLKRRFEVQSSMDRTEKNRAYAIANQAQAEMMSVAEDLQTQYQQLQGRWNTFGQMQTLHGQLEGYRRGRGENLDRDMKQAAVLSQVTDYGDQLLSEYEKLDHVARETQSAHSDLSQVLASEEINEQTFEQLNAALEALGTVAQHHEQMPAFQKKSGHHEQLVSMNVHPIEGLDEDGEMLHEPDVEFEEPAPVPLDDESGVLDKIVALEPEEQKSRRQKSKKMMHKKRSKREARASYHSDFDDALQAQPALLKEAVSSYHDDLDQAVDSSVTVTINQAPEKAVVEPVHNELQIDEFSAKKISPRSNQPMVQELGMSGDAFVKDRALH